ncbi:TRAP transporter large permease [Hydrogenophaga electricum]|nr:TRAP transporter large permease [Hydrogenophaga electricum]
MLLDNPILILLLGIGVMLLLMALHVPIGVAMAISGLTLFAMLATIPAALGTISVEIASALSSSDLITIPLFLLMGSLGARAGISSDIYRMASQWVGHHRGGLAMATVVGCAGFGALCGSSVATAATMGRVALPEMLDRGYKPSLATGSIASGGTLGILIPPSIVMVIYAVLTEQFVLDLFVAGILPGLLAMVLYCLAVVYVTQRDPAAGPAFAPVPMRQRWASILHTWRGFLVLGAVVAGLYSGLFTVAESASMGLGLTMAFFLAHVPRSAWMRELKGIAVETAQNTGMIFLMVIGAALFSYFLTITEAPQALVTMVEDAHLNPYVVLAVVIVMYILLGAVFDDIAAMILTTPFVFPMIVGLGFDPIWWGIMMVMVIQIGMIAPPIGINVFVIGGIARDIPLSTIYRGIMPFFWVDILRLIILTIFPGIALYLVHS